MARASDPAAARAGATWIVRALRDAGHVAYFAGGCVRDALLGIDPTDFDVATDATPRQVQTIFPKSDAVGASFGVVLVHVPRDVSGGSDRVSVEVATFRSDGPYSDARRPDRVEFSTPEADAQRRDFTINAIFLDPLVSGARAGALEGQVIDYVGGVDDLERRVIRAVGDPEARLAEDHLRALRAVRFAARLGCVIDAATARAISKHAGDLRGVSRERIGEELRRILAHPTRAQGVSLLVTLGLDAPVLNLMPGPAEHRLLSRLPAACDSTTALAAWLLDRAWPTDRDAPIWIDPEPPRRRGEEHADTALVTTIRQALCLSNDESETLRRTLALVARLAQQWIDAGVAQRKRWATNSVFVQALAVLRAWRPEAAQALHQTVHQLDVDGIGLGPAPFVTGDDLVAEGFTPNPKFKAALDTAYDAQLEGRVRSKTEAMELARRLCV